MKLKKAEHGFTLIEIVCVLIILGILMAVAIPRYVYLIEHAKIKTIESALGGAGSHVSLLFAREILKTGTQPTMERLQEILSADGAGYTYVGDFEVAYAASDEVGITITVTGSSVFDMPATGGPFEKTIILVPDG